MSRGLFSNQNQVGESYSFTTNKNGTFYWYIDKHDPLQYPVTTAIIKTPGRNTRVDYGDGSQPESPLLNTLGSTVISSAQSHVYGDGSDKVVTFTTDKLADIRYFNIGFTNTVNNVFTGKTNLDLTPFPKLYSIQFNRNTNITGVTLNINGEQPGKYFYGNSCDLTGTLDISSLNMTNHATFNVSANPNLDKIIFPTNVKITGNNTANNCNLSGHYDFSSWSGVSSQMNWSSNNITGFTFPTITGTAGSCVNGVFLNSNDLVGTLDLSPLEQLGNVIRVDGNSLLTQLITPSNTRNISTFAVNNCDITGVLDISGLSGMTVSQTSDLSFAVNGCNNLSGITTTDGLNRFDSTLFRSNFSIATTNLPGMDISGCSFTNLSDDFQLSFNNAPELEYLLLPTHPLTYTINLLNGGDAIKLTDLNISAFNIDGTFAQTSPRIDLGGCTVLSGLTVPLTAKTGETHFFVRNCNLSGTLDLTNYTGLMKVNVSSNSNLTGLLLPTTTSTQTLTDATVNNTTKVFELHSCSLGYVDFKPMSGLTLNSSSTILLQNNNMTTGEVNHILVDFVTTTWDGVTLDISGTNAAPDSISGGFDGISAISTLTGGTNNWTIITS